MLEHQAYMDRFIDAYLYALGSDSIVLEKDSVPSLLSVDNLQHPLLCNAQCLPDRNQESVMNLQLDNSPNCVCLFSEVLIVHHIIKFVLMLFSTIWILYCVSSMREMSRYA